MVPTIVMTKQDLDKLPDEVLRLIGMGQYTLYSVEVSAQPEVCFVLRTGEREFFFLKEDGEPLSFNDFPNFKIRERVNIEDVPVFAVVPNFHRP
ncbi:hypothetical protein ACQ4N7_08825 [Nodosilinea sp. AN01ver1]|uniref:hypothetical protein n=1 Tax=Nodosilinea sp. AN01ver1 TaxID=3423362 RepID=UPI003D31D09B